MPTSTRFIKTLTVAGVVMTCFITGARAQAQRKIYVDSVPSGASVYLLPKIDGDSGKRLVGKTPLVLDASEASSMRFWVMINMEAYLKEIERIPKLRDWVTKVRSDRFPGTYIPRYFDFEFDSTQGAKGRDGKIVGVGPVVTLDFPTQSRIAVVFLPEGEKLSTLFPIMPPSGTFRVSESEQRKLLMNRYGLRETDATEAIEALSRCGKAWILVLNSPQRGHTRELIMTDQGPDNPTVTITENFRKK
ncbi:MAG: hypothetical protein L0Z50_19250 [Verrucomicrobiales bacterium]|nr:hypothetical protein [Verrucomicrobiales bacterium]